MAVLARASVDIGSFKVSDARCLPFLVHVTGHLTSGELLPARDYQIAADEMATAAFAGLARYEHEMQRVN